MNTLRGLRRRRTHMALGRGTRRSLHAPAPEAAPVV